MGRAGRGGGGVLEEAAGVDEVPVEYDLEGLMELIANLVKADRFAHSLVPGQAKTFLWSRAVEHTIKYVRYLNIYLRINDR